MDSMVGYKTPRYLRFGWCGARLDDVMNYVPARLTWLLIAAVAAVLAVLLGTQGVAHRLHASTRFCSVRIPAGARRPRPAGLQRRLVGPIWMKGQLVTDVWIGDPADPPAQARADVTRSLVLVTATGLAATLTAVVRHAGVLSRDAASRDTALNQRR